jgi:tetratricopeptide (TPR) repeat protein
VIDLPDVTLLAADTANHALALRALAHSMAGIRFARTLWLTDAVPPGIDVPSDITIAPIAPIASRDAYSQLVLKSLAPYVETSHVLLVQWDGFVIHPEAWDPRFLDCDYLGARWFWHKDGMTVGNGGFSLRSKKLLDALADPRIQGDAAEDELIGRTFRPLLEREHGIRFGSEAMADRFSFEAAYPVGKPFGFHGLYNFVRVLPQQELATMAAQFSDAIARSPQCLQLLRNARALAQWRAVAALAERMLAAAPGDPEATAAAAEARAHDRPFAGVGRNEPCPCGSGKRFKQCHGSPIAQPIAASPVAGEVETLTQRGMTAHQRGDIDAAKRDYQAALAIDADAPHPAHYLGVIHYQRGQFGDAQPLIERSRTQVPQEAEFHNNAGLLYAAMDRIDDAVAAYRDAIARRPNHVTAWNNLGLALNQRNDLTGAIDSYRRALAIKPDFAEARWNLALALLARGDYAEGWREYDARLALPALSGNARGVPGVRYGGEPLEGRRLLLIAEQGLGDTLQFIRFAREFADHGAQVIVQVPAPLLRLCASAPGVAQAIAATDAVPDFDYQLPLLSVGSVLTLDAMSVTAQVPYLVVDPERAAHWRAVVDAQPARLHVGLSWAGNPQHANDRRRSIALATLAPLLGLREIAWYSLQRIDGEDQIRDVPAAQSLRLLDARNNFDDKAALMQSLDLVISVDTSNAHLAGALGVPLWVLLPHAADWRWGTAGSTTPWYPGAQLYRQTSARDWREPVAAVMRALQARLGA